MEPWSAAAEEVQVLRFDKFKIEKINKILWLYNLFLHIGHLPLLQGRKPVYVV